MYNRIESLIDIFYNMIRAAVYLDWGGFNQQLSNLRDWFNGFIDDIYKAINDAVNSLRSWVQSWITWLDSWSDWVESQFNAAWAAISKTLTDAKNYAYGIVNDVYSWAASQLDGVYNYVVAQINIVYDWAAAQVNAAKTYAYDIVNNVWDYVYASIKPWLDWLQPVKFYVDWFVQTGYYNLKQFIANPLEYILGLFAPILRYWLTYLEEVKALLVAFINEVMADLYNFWQLYAVDLRAFMVDPGAWILAKMKLIFFDWLFTLLDEVW